MLLLLVGPALAARDGRSGCGPRPRARGTRPRGTGASADGSGLLAGGLQVLLVARDLELLGQLLATIGDDATVDAADRLLAAGIQVLHVWGPKNFHDGLTARVDEATGARKESASGLFGLFPALAKRLLAVW